MSVASRVGGDQEAEEASRDTQRFTLPVKSAQDDARLEEAIGSVLAGAVEALRKEQQAMRQELQEQQQTCIASLEERLNQRAAEEREDLNSVLTDWYAQSTLAQQEQSEAIEQLRCQAATGAHPGAGAEESGKAAAAAQEPAQALREELLALRAEDMLALQEAIASLSEDVSKALQGERGSKDAADGEDSGAILERLESLEVACTEMAGRSQQHHDLIHEVKSSSDQAHEDLIRLATEIDGRLRGAEERDAPQGGCSAEEAQALSESVTMLAVKPVLERLVAVEDGLAALRSQPKNARADTEALAAALDEVRARAEGDVSQLAREVEMSEAAIHEARAAADRAQGDVGNLAEEVAALGLRLQALDVEEGQTAEAERRKADAARLDAQQVKELPTPVCATMARDIGARMGKLEAIVGGGVAVPDREQVKVWTMEAFHQASGHLSQRMRDLEDGLPGLRCTVAEVQGLALSADSGLRDVVAESTRHGLQAQTLAKKIATLEGSIFDGTKQEQLRAMKEQASRDASEELLRRVQTLEEKVTAPTSPQVDCTIVEEVSDQGAAVTAERARELAAEVMQDFSQELHAMLQGELTHVLSAAEDLRSQVERWRTTTNTVIEEIGVRMQALEGQDARQAVQSEDQDAAPGSETVRVRMQAPAERVKGLEAVVRQISAVAETQLDATDAKPDGRGSSALLAVLEDPSQTELTMNGSLPSPPRATLSTESAAKVAALAPGAKLGKGAHGEASDQQPALCERLQGLVDMAENAAWSLGGSADTSEPRGGAQEPRPVATALEPQPAAPTVWSPVSTTGMQQSFVINSEAHVSDLSIHAAAGEQVGTTAGLSILAATSGPPSGMQSSSVTSPRCSPRGGPVRDNRGGGFHPNVSGFVRHPSVPGLPVLSEAGQGLATASPLVTPRVTSGLVASQSSIIRRSPSVKSGSLVASRPQSPVRWVVVGQSQVTDAAPVRLVRSPAHQRSSPALVMVPPPIPGWAASGVAPGGSPRIPPASPQLFAHQAGRT